MASLEFDIDVYLNRFIPRNRVHRLPTRLAWFLGYREQPREKIGNVLIWWWAFVGAFAGLLVVEAVFQTKALKAEGTPIVIASFGAAAILEYHVIDSPLSQPRNAILGQVLSAFIGISVSKLFQLSPNFEGLRWVSGALSVGIASALMGVTKTVHPPAGATALLCSTDGAVVALGWKFLWMVTLGSVLLVVVALVVNNLGRTWPVYWWTPADLGRKEVNEKRTEEDLEKRAAEESEGEQSSRDHIIITAESMAVPPWLGLEVEEKAVLEELSARLRNKRRKDSDATNVAPSTHRGSESL